MLMTTAQSESSVRSVLDRGALERGSSFATMMVHVDVARDCEPTEEDCRAVSARLDDIGSRFRVKGQHLKQVEWRTALELPYELVSREARAADLIIVAARHTGHSVHDLVDPGVILLRAGRPVLVVPDVVAPPQLRRAVVAWKETRECRRAVRDALPFLQRAEEV